MSIPNKKLKNGFEIPIFGIGTWHMGGSYEIDRSRDGYEIEAIQNAIEHGVTHIDSAEGYAKGHSEELVGKAIEGYDRSKLFLVSKVSPEHFGYDDLLRACEASMRRMKTDYLDLYMMHRPSLQLPIEEPMRALNHLKDEGYIRNIGVSNFTAERLEEAQRVSKHPIVENQVHYNLSVREIERKGVLKYCQENDIMVIAWRPIRDIMKIGELPLIKEMCEKYQKTPVQIAINWLISQKNVVTLTKTSAPEHLEENLGAVGWEMEGDDVERIRKEFPNQVDVSESVPLV